MFLFWPSSRSEVASLSPLASSTVNQGIPPGSSGRYFFITSLPEVIRSTSTFRTTKSRVRIAPISGRGRKSSSLWHQPHQGAPKVRKTLCPRTLPAERGLEHHLEHHLGVLRLDHPAG